MKKIKIEHVIEKNKIHHFKVSGYDTESGAANSMQIELKGLERMALLRINNMVCSLNLVINECLSNLDIKK